MNANNGSVTVEALARLSGTPAHTIRYYTRRGLLNPARNPANAYRLYSDADFARLRFIHQAKSLGFSLGDISRLLTMAELDASSRVMVRSLLARRLAENKRRLHELTVLQMRMERAVELWSRFPDGAALGRSVAELIEAASGSP
jgi:DNA-binding transcriptional MerR regulator